jgi:hypothetical protein
MDPGWVKNQDPDPGSRPGMNISDHISESLETIFWVKNTDSESWIFMTMDPGSEMEKIRIRDKHPRSATLTRTRTEEEGWALA